MTDASADDFKALRVDPPHALRIRRRTWMKGTAATLSTVASAAVDPAAGAASETDRLDEAAKAGWWTWRGPHGNNIAASSTFQRNAVTPEAVVWQTPVPGRGHSSPIVTDRAIYLTTADTIAGTQSVLAFDRCDGKPLWAEVVHRGGLPQENHRKNTEASPTVAFDGKRVIAAFYNRDAIWLTALNTDGQRLWQKSLGPYLPQRYRYGYAASPTIFQDTAIVVAEFDGPAFLTAVSLQTGEPVWRTERPNSTSFSSPIVAKVAGRDQLLISGQSTVTSYAPATGELLWTAPATAMATCGTVVWDDENVYASGGFPQAQTAGIKADGSAKVLWVNNQKCYEQSMLCAAGHVYAVTDQGVAYCWRASDGETMWRERLGGNYSSSPILAGDTIHVFNEAGQSFAFAASPMGFVSRGSGKIGDEAFASPTIVSNTMFMRFAKNENGVRQEYLSALR